MVPIRRQAIFMALKFFDLVLMISCFFLASYFVNNSLGHINIVDFFSMRIAVKNFLIFGGIIISWLIILNNSGIYSRYRLHSLLVIFYDIIKIASISTLFLVMLKQLFDIQMFSNIYLAVFWMLDCGLLILWRLTIRLLSIHLRYLGRNQRSLLFVGINHRSLRFARKIEEMSYLGYHIIGFVDNEEHRLHDFSANDKPFIHFEELPNFLTENTVDEIMVCLPLKSLYKEASEVISACEEQGIVVRLFSDQFDLKLARSTTTKFGNELITTLITGEMVGNKMILKRVFDFSASLILLILFAPLLILTSILIKVTSPGPIFFIQTRIGRNKREIGVIKFRTMHPGAEKMIAELEELNEVSGPVFKIKDDPRITPIGKILRKTSIDELPQLFNVFLGNMSLVGPRPLPVRDYLGFNENWHRRRFSVKPGITCLWQISGRNNISFEEWMELDMQYIDHWSLWLDLKILTKTIPAVLKGSGAA